jgi:hypothetical protein
MFHKRIGFALLLAGVFYFLVVLPTTGWDYEVYKQAFDASYFSDKYPWFQSRTILTSEPFYLWYNSFWGVILPLGFSWYLAVNFLVCVVISKFTFKKFKPDHFLYFWLMFLPVIIPTVFYFSPRSSISFILIFCAMVTLTRHKYLWATLLFFMGCMTHSQFLLITFLIIGTYILLYRANYSEEKYMRIIKFLSIFLFIALNFMSQLSSVLVNFLSFLPTVKIIAAKMHYFESEDGENSSFRLTAILSILIYPILSYSLVKLISQSKRNLVFLDSIPKKTELLFTYMLFAIMAYGAVINLSFLNESHVAGRLSRLSDYIGMGLVLPLYMRLVLNEITTKWVLILFCLVAPLLFATLYINVDWNIL